MNLRPMIAIVLSAAVALGVSACGHDDPPRMSMTDLQTRLVAIDPEMAGIDSAELSETMQPICQMVGNDEKAALDKAIANASAQDSQEAASQVIAIASVEIQYCRENS